jgi:anti-sigma factor RsiW
MNWTCEQTELLLTDYLDGLLPADEQRAFDLHVNSCARCTPLLSSVMHAMSRLRALPELETPPHLVYNILDSTLGPRETVSGWAAFLAWLKSLASPKFAYGAVSLAATFLMIVTVSGSVNWKKPKLADLTPSNIYRNTNRQVHVAYGRATKYVSDLRVVYEIQSRLRQDNEVPTNRENTTPESNPTPGRTDGSGPASPRQQNRANDVSSQLQVLAEEVPLLSGKLSLVSSGRLDFMTSGKLGFVIGGKLGVR